MKRLSIACMALLVAGCASFTPKPLDPGAQSAAFESRSLASPAVREFLERSLGHALTPWPPKSWDLATLTLAACYFQPDLDVAQARSLLAQAGVISAGARPNPTASTSFRHKQDAPAGASPWRYSPGISVPIETAGKRDYRIERARHLAQAARLREADAVWQVRSRVRASLLAAYPTEALVRRQRDLQAQVVSILERRLAAGDASQPDVTQTRLALNRITLALRENQKQRAVNLTRLASAVGVPVQAMEGAKVSFAAFERLVAIPDLPPEEARRKALLSRPDVLAALAGYEASQSALQLEVAKQYPDLSLGPGYIWNAGAVSWSLGLSAVLPLLNRNEGPIAEAEARRKEAAATFLSVQSKAIAQVEESLAGYRYAVRMFETADALVRDQKRKENAAAAAFKAGEVDRLTWLSAQSETATAELARVNASLQVQRTLGRLEDALRAPLGADAPALVAQPALSFRPHLK